jgi:NADH-quinone oxidoreductase subunit C
LSSADVDQTEGSDAPPVDEVRTGMLATLTEALGDAIVGSHIEKGDIWVRVRLDSWRAAAEACKTLLDCDYFCYLSAIDWMPSSAPNPEDAIAEDGDASTEPEPAAEPGAGLETGYAGGDTRFQVFCRLYSTTKHWGVTLKADVPEGDERVESIESLYRGADWHERECWEMYGFDFGHPRGMRHLYLPSEFEGHPGRKDFPLLAREVKPWPGLVDIEPMPGDEDGEAEGEEAAES